MPTPPRDSLPWSYEWDRVLGRSVTGAAWVLGLSVVAGLVAFLWYRTTVEPTPGFPVQYAPPPGLGPVQTEYIRTESVPKNGLTATLFYLAERGWSNSSRSATSSGTSAASRPAGRGPTSTRSASPSDRR